MNLRAAILDYPLLTIEKNPEAAKMLNDVLIYKQKAFFQTNADYVVMDKHDMTGTHFLIYETSDIYRPRLVLAMRNCYETRARRHGLRLPVEDYIELGGERAVRLLAELKSRVGPLVDCNAWFVDPNFSNKTSGLRLSELGFILMTSYTYRLGYSHAIGATNERYGASRWARLVGDFPEGLSYQHPFLKDPHCICLIEHFRQDWMLKGLTEYRDFFFGAQEILGRPEDVRPLDEIVSILKKPYANLGA